MPARGSPPYASIAIDHNVSCGLTTYTCFGPAPLEARATTPQRTNTDTASRSTLPNMCSHDTHEHPFVSSQLDALRPDISPVHVEQQHRAARRAPALGRRARIEDPDAAVAHDLGDVRMAVDDRVTVGKPRPQAGRAPRRRPGDVQH